MGGRTEGGEFDKSICWYLGSPALLVSVPDPAVSVSETPPQPASPTPYICSQHTPHIQQAVDDREEREREGGSGHKPRYEFVEAVPWRSCFNPSRGSDVIY